MMRLIVEDQNVLLPTYFSAQDSVNKRCIAFNVLGGLDVDFLDVALLVLLLSYDGQQACVRLPVKLFDG